MLIAAGLAFAVAAVAGLGLAALSSWWLVAVGAVCIAAAWTYTGGPLPYGYRALGEVFVFVFFGPVAVVGTTYVQTGTLPGLAFAVSVPIGLLIVAILVVNNLRDIHGDAAVGKRTLAVLLGDRATRLVFVGLFVVAFAVIAAVGVARPWALIALLAAPWRCPRADGARRGAGPALIARSRAPACSPWPPVSCWAPGWPSAADLPLGAAQPGAEVLLGRPRGRCRGPSALVQPFARGRSAGRHRHRQQQAEEQADQKVQADQPEDRTRAAAMPSRPDGVDQQPGQDPRRRRRAAGRPGLRVA